jgi:NodT family efflux transporter outer membrane factor (OMF) lipoprotein
MPRLRIVCAALMVSWLAGCAALPHLPDDAKIKQPDALQSAASFSAPVSEWPANGWWHRYGDSQLDQLIDHALAGSPTLAMARARLEAAQAMSQIAGASRLPQVSANAAAMEGKQSYNFLAPRAALPQGWNDYGTASLDFSWELDFWGKNRAAVAAAISDERASAVEVDQARLMLSAAIAQAYAELAHLYASRDTAARALDVRRQAAELIRQRQHEELETLATVRQAEAQQAAADAELQGADERIALQKNAIAALVGEGPDRGLTIARPSAKVDRVFGLPSQLAMDLIGRRPDLVAARLRAEAAAKRIDEDKAAFYPSINLVGSVGVMSLGLDNLAKGTSSFGGVGPAISLPIFNTERLQGQLRGAHAEYDAAVASYNATLVNALHEVADVVTSRKALDGQLASLQSSVASVEQAYQMVSKRYRGGLASYLEVLSVEDTLLSARRALADAQSRSLALDVALARSLGGGFQAPAAP